jgi:sensor histidine kinase YesM
MEGRGSLGGTPDPGLSGRFKFGRSLFWLVQLERCSSAQDLNHDLDHRWGGDSLFLSFLRKAARPREAKLKLLEAQLDPHLLFNTLANLRVLIGIDSAKAQTMLDHMIAYLRATLSGSRTSEHSLEQEFARLRDYLELMQFRMGARLRFELDLPDAMKHVSIPSLLLQPLVENAIKHGLELSKDGVLIKVSAQQQAGSVVINIKDTGLGGESTAFDASAQSQGYGLSQVRERLTTVYGAGAKMRINSTPNQGALVRASAIESVQRDESGRQSL